MDNNPVREIQLSKGYVALVDDEDYEWLSERSWYANGTKSKGIYARASYRNKNVTMHRLILGLPKGEGIVDHIDGNSLNNQRSNIRVCSQGENLQKARGRDKITSSKYLGVDRHSKSSSSENANPWRAAIKVRGVTRNLGCFKTEEEAALAYNKAAKEIYGEHARLNIIP